MNMVKKKRNLQSMEIRWKKTAGTRLKVGNLKKGGQRIKVYSSSSLRNRLVNLCPELYRSGITRMLFNDLILLRIMSCDYKLLPSKVGKSSCMFPIFHALDFNHFQLTQLQDSLKKNDTNSDP